MQQSLRHIVIVGAGLRVWLPAAYLAARFPEQTCQITVVSFGEDGEEADILARPETRRIHQVLQVTERELAGRAQARPALHSAVATESGGTVRLPFGAYGQDRAGTQFYQYWRRADLAGKARPIETYNLALQLAAARVFIPKPPDGFPAFDYGYIFSRAGYADLLKECALKRAASVGGLFKKANLSADKGHITSIETDRGQVACDMVIDVTASGKIAALIGGEETGWTGNCLAVHTPSNIPGMELLTLQASMERLIALLPGRDFAPCETAEYNRLATAERLRIKDMETLLNGGHNSAALQRKTDVFSARGRLPVEDHEVFTGPEWLAALMACAQQPQRYDRLVDRVSLDDITGWLNGLEQAIQQLLQRAQQRVAI